MSNRFTENVFLPACRLAIKLAEQSGGNVIAMNDFLGMWCVSDSYNLWKDIDGNGNYWSRYRKGIDVNGDGRDDTPHQLFSSTGEIDDSPALSPYFPNEEVEWDLCGFEEP